MKAPFPWFGGKRLVAGLVWSRLGDVATYNEPFAGSLAVLLDRPTAPRIETVNDLDCYLANFWRALQQDPDGVARYADSPVNEADLHARHRWLVEVARPTAERVMRDPHFYDVKLAGWWVWGQCLWIGSGWCQRFAETSNFKLQTPRNLQAPSFFNQRTAATRSVGENPVEQMKRPKLRGRGVDGVPYVSGLSEKKPKLDRQRNGVSTRRWQGGGRGGGSGVHAPRLSRSKPVLYGASGASGNGIHASGFEEKTGGLYEYMRALAARLRRVRVCCGDWGRVLTPSVTTYIGVTGVLLDPPYSQDLRERCYSEDHDISHEVREWALQNGDNPKMRIALCGYESEHGRFMPPTWEKVAWKAHGGYSRTERGKANRAQERIWFSPHCLKPAEEEGSLFGL